MSNAPNLTAYATRRARAGRRNGNGANGGNGKAPQRAWYTLQVRNGDDDPDKGQQGTVAELYLYDEIGMFGITAQQLVDELAEVQADRIEVHLNSPGGDVFDGIAIFNALVQSQAGIDVHVDALAASVASVIAMAGDTVTMGRYATMMIHQGWGVTIGDAEDMRSMADLLDKTDANIAQVYADRAGGDVDEWMDRMRAETWFSADEAVRAGLADSVAPLPTRNQPPGDDDEGEDGNGDDEGEDANGAGGDDDKRKAQLERLLTAQHDLSRFRHRGREGAPQPDLSARKGGDTGPSGTQGDPNDSGATLPATDPSGDGGGEPAADDSQDLAARVRAALQGTSTQGAPHQPRIDGATIRQALQEAR